MIAYDMQCSNGHVFEGWFEDSKAFEDQQSKELISCPVCSIASVAIVPSTFAIKTSTGRAEKPKDADKPQDDWSPHKVVDFLEKNFEDVGVNFAREALKMHYGVSEKRNIKGTSTNAEEEVLEKEGIKFFKVPVPRLDS
jgi:hypothetical protein